MSTDATLEQLALELAAEWDSTLDTSVGSDFRTKFLDPFLVRIGGSPLDVDLETFYVERVGTEIEEADTSPFSAMRDLVVRAFTVMATPLRREVAGIKTAQSLNNYASMTRDEVNALLGNYFTALRDGGIAQGIARMYFPSPQSISVSPTTQFSAGSGLNFFPSIVQTISSTQMSFQQEGELYYLDVVLEAEGAGDAYNIDVDSISTVEGITGVTRVTNQRKFVSGLDEETKEEGVARAAQSITIRNLITKRGVEFVLPENFPSVDTLQVIGKGDDEMDRDIINGPVTVSSIPGGFKGQTSPDLAFGEFIHIGGKTDIYIYQPSPDEEDIDIENLTDKGVRVHSGMTGFTSPGAPTVLFEDPSGFFSTRGVASGDFLLIGSDEFLVDSVVGDSSINVDAGTPLDAGQFNVTYEIVRRSTGQVTVPLYDLVAESGGLPVFDDAGAPVAPIPGAPSKAPLYAGGALVATTENISSENVQLPLLRITDVEFLDPLTLEASGDIVPMRDILLSQNTEAFYDLGSTIYGGTMRLYFRDAVNTYVDAGSTIFSEDDRVYRPIGSVAWADASYDAGVPDENVNEIFVTGDRTSIIAAGDRFEFLSGTGVGQNFCIRSVAYNGSETVLTVRETLSDTFGAPEATSQSWEVHVGILEANMSQEASTGLYFFDIQVTDTSSGIAGARVIGTTFISANVTSEGWTLKTTYDVWSYSTRELPYFQISEWVNDTTQLFITFTAPALRISYEYAGDLADIQRFSNAPENRIVAEDVLIRHFTPAYVRTTFEVVGSTDADAKAALITFINELDPTDDLEVSDVSTNLYSTVGVTKVVMPVTLTALAQASGRIWTAEFSQDALDSSRIQHFIADEDFITISQES